ncbi:MULTISPECIES: DnaB-like helicase N-terminal domain-containing protein [unclassified Streptomyces]|uniref:DnaB-like helicase N-terminal domain-containing protein n=1 Tax=unclassified Streptomyces TaxID=2593676 RepID=UPI001EF13CAA|nr:MULTISPECIES: DnaB-like helicase N-terminal domain-containing protein [unclassified Streptomyces]
MIRADHARRTLLTHAERLAQTATDTTLPNPATSTLAQADTLGQFLDTLTAQFTPHPGSLPHTLVPDNSAGHSSEEALDEERVLLATATAHPAELKNMRWLQPDDFTLTLHATLWQCMTALVHSGEPVDPVTVLWEAPRTPHRRPRPRRPHRSGLRPRRLTRILGTASPSTRATGPRIRRRHTNRRLRPRPGQHAAPADHRQPPRPGRPHHPAKPLATQHHPCAAGTPRTARPGPLPRRPATTSHRGPRTSTPMNPPLRPAPRRPEP